jgi:ribokinase
LRPEDADVESVHRASVLLLQLEVPLETVTAAARATTGTVVLNPAPARPLPADLLADVDVLVPNEHELAQLAEVAVGERPPSELAKLARSVGSGSVVVTLGARGALVVPADGAVQLQAPPPVTAVDTTGAGDCFCGALAQALARGEELGSAVRYAVTAAALSTTGPGARGALPDDDAVRALLPQVPDAVSVD